MMTSRTALKDGTVVNAMTVDVEDYFQVSAFEPHIPREQWEVLPNRVETNTRRILELFDAHGVHATFFVLGWVAEHFPHLVEEIDRAGHEIGTHSYAHRLVHTLSRAEFVQDLRRSVDTLSSITGKRVRGHRAPSFSVTEATPWVFEELLAAGLDYDSSVLPMPRYYGGMAMAPRRPYQVKVGDGSTIREFPVPTARVFGRNVCFAGGGYFRVLPLSVVRRGITRLNHEGTPAMIYFHPWEIDPDPPRLKMAFRDRFQGRFSNELFRGGMERKLETILREFSFTPMGDILDAVLPAGASA